jgi:aconitate hydratase
VSRGLIRDIVRFHLAPEAEAADDWAIGEELPLRVDHVLAAGRAGLLALRAFGRIATGPARVDLALASADRGAGPAAFETPEELQALHAAAGRAGVRFSRAGHGRGDVVHRERFAVPGRILLTAGRRDAAAGALGMLALAADPIEVGAVLGGGAYALEWPGVRFLDCRGELPAAVDGYDVWLALAAIYGARGVEGAFIEATGEGVAALSMADRLALAAGAGALRSRAVLFPSDEATRAALRAQGREPEWKPFPPAEPGTGDPVIVLELAEVVPHCAPLESVGEARPLAETGDTGIDVVEIGPGAAFADLDRLARCLDDRRVHDRVTLVVVPGSRQIMEAARERGVLDRLVAAGARVLEPGMSAGVGAAPGGRSAGLCAGVRPDPVAGAHEGWWTAGIDTCAAACLSGALRDPRAADLPRGRIDEPQALPATDAWIIRPEAAGADGEPAGDDPSPPFPLGAPIEGPLRGMVLIVAGDGVAAESILPWGARIRPLLGDMDRLGRYVFHGIDDGFPDRARRHGGGWIVAGAHFGQGVARDPAALALVALGVRGVLAVSFAADCRRQLVHAGVLPLRFVVPAEHGRCGRGDELEIPGLPEAFWEGAPLVVRNLTRGTSFTVRHELTARQLEILAAGGLLRRAAGAAREVA